MNPNLIFICETKRKKGFVRTICRNLGWGEGTRANNWKEGSYIEARLDRFFGAAHWLLGYDKAIVNHVEKQSSDHNLLFLDTKPDQRPRKTRFYCDKMWVQKTGIEDIVKTDWDTKCDDLCLG